METGGPFQCHGSIPSQMPVPLVFMTLSLTVTLRTKSASCQAHSGASSMAKCMRLNSVLPAIRPLLDLMIMPRPLRLPIVLLTMAKPLPFAEGEATTSSAHIELKLSGQEASLTCAQPQLETKQG